MMGASLAPISRLTFDEETHTFYFDGERVPSVTEILKSAGTYNYDAAGSGAGYSIPEEVLENARDRGKEVHEATQLDDEDDLDEESLSEDVLPYLDSYRAWRRDMGFKPELIEQPVFDEQLRYAGICDRAGYIDHQHVVVDIKTVGGLKIWHSKQLAAYANCVKKPGAHEWPWLIVLELKPNTKRGYHEHIFGPDAAKGAFDVFVAALKIWKDRTEWTTKRRR
jgi:hypothetical protein